MTAEVAPGRRPLVAIPARFSASASALRYAAEVVSRALVEAVYAAGGEPVVVHPSMPDGHVDEAAVGERLWFADAVLLPGGGDLAAHWSGQAPHESQYDVDAEQDAFDLAVARWALATRVPMLAICRGNQVVNVALGGDLVQDMDEVSGGDHRHLTHRLRVDASSPLAGVVGASPLVSCYHHQCLGRLGAGLVPVAKADDGTVEAVALPGHDGWYLGVQWHPEDTAGEDSAQAGLFRSLVAAALNRVPA
jgi:putative glutamine amidotransferase